MSDPVHLWFYFSIQGEISRPMGMLGQRTDEIQNSVPLLAPHRHRVQQFAVQENLQASAPVASYLFRHAPARGQLQRTVGDMTKSPWVAL